MAPPTASRPGRALLALVAIIVVMYGVVAAGAAFGKGSWTPKLGLDLEGGTSVTLIPRVQGGGSITDQQVNEAVNIIRQRVDAFGVGESEVVAQGSGNQRSIVISIPGKKDRSVLDRVRQTAQLRFRPVLAEAPAAAVPQPTPTPSAGGTPSAKPSGTATPTGKATVAPATPKPTSSTNGRAVPKGLKAATSTPAPAPTSAGASATPLAPGASTASGTPATAGVPKALQEKFATLTCNDPKKRPADVPAKEYMVACSQDGAYKYLLAPADVVGTDLSDASAGLESTSQGASTGNWLVQLKFDSAGGKKFADSTTKLYQQQPPQNQFAIVLDGQVMSAPRVNEPITGGSAQITGNFTQKTATDLANVLRYGALPLSFQPGDVQEISPTLGSDQLSAGILAGIIGLILVVLYSLLYYRGLGIVSILSLVVAAVITYGSVVLLGERIGFRLSLAGVAGMIVAIGITADSFIVYFERLRDELRDGRTLRVAVEVGWQRARRTILAADFVSFLAAVVLYVLSVGSVRGFAFTLGLTTLIDVLVVFLFTKPMVTLLARRPFFRDGHRFSGLEPAHIGGRARQSTPSTPIVARRSAAAGSAGAAGSKEA